jgi:predicted ATPase
MTVLAELSIDQAQVLDAVLGWYQDCDADSVLTPGGYAGTGKTTLIAEVARRLPNVEIAFTAYTGKAANVLRTKLPWVVAHMLHTTGSV